MTWLALAALVSGCAIVTTTLAALAAGLFGACASAGASWQERARRWWPVRVSVGLAALAIPLAVCFVASGDGGGALSRLHHACVALAGVGAAAATSWVLLRPSGLSRSPVGFVRSVVATALLLGYPLVFALALLLAYPARWGPSALWLAVSTPVLWLGSSYLILPLLNLLGIVHRADDVLLRRVQAATPSRGAVAKAVWVADIERANALAFPVGREMLVSRPLLAILDGAELDAILAHESVHLAMPWARILRRLVVPMVLLLLPAGLPLWRTGDTRHLAGWFVIAVLLAARALRGSPHVDEREADDGAHHDTESADALASALARNYEHNLTAVTAKSRTHPTLVERLEELGGEVPEAVRQPVSSVRRLAGLLVATAGACVTVLAYTLATRHLAG